MNCKNKSTPSLLLLLPLFVLIFRNTVMIRRRLLEDYAAVDAYAVIDIICIVIMGFVCLQMKRRTVRHSPCYFLVLYYVFAILSCAWSISFNNNFYTIFRAMSIIIILFYCIKISQVFDDKKTQLLWLVRAGAWITGFEFFKALSIGALHTNSYTITAAMTLILALGLIKANTIKFSEVMFSVILATAALVLGTSSASNIAFAAGVVFILCTSRNRVNWTLLSLFLLGCYLAYAFFFEIIMTKISMIFFPDKEYEEIMKASGRFYIWEYYLRRFCESPLLGFGFPIGEKMGIYDDMYFQSIHNGFISVLLNTGIAGFLLFGTFIVKMSRCILKGLANNACFVALLGVWVVALTNNLSYPLLGSILNVPFIYLIMILVFYTVPTPICRGSQYDGTK